jgi:hypothetical protein
MSNVLNQAEASYPLYQKKMRECTICKNAGFSEQLITFQNMGDDSVTGKTIWKPIDENGNEHKHKFNISDTKRSAFMRKKVVDIAVVTNVNEAKELLLQGWEYKTSYTATISNIPHFVLIKRE